MSPNETSGICTGFFKVGKGTGALRRSARLDSSSCPEKNAPESHGDESSGAGREKILPTSGETPVPTLMDCSAGEGGICASAVAVARASTGVRGFRLSWTHVVCDAADGFSLRATTKISERSVE